MEIGFMKKIKKYLLYLVAFILFSLFEGYRWQGFLPRVIVAILVFKLGDAGAPEYNTASGGKLKFLACGLLIYAACKFIYDYTKAGKEAEAKKRNDYEQ